MIIVQVFDRNGFGSFNEPNANSRRGLEQAGSVRQQSMQWTLRRSIIVLIGSQAVDLAS